MARHFPDWINAYIEYASFSEAPTRMHFWSAVSSIAGVLRRRTWLEMGYFTWTPCFYVVLVAPPGVVSKSTTAGIAMDILRRVPGVKFGPQVVTWPALVEAFEQSREEFEWNGEYHAQCALTIESSEFGNLVNPADREMIDLLVTLWDAKKGGFKKVTKTSGVNVVENPWINLIACTTPAWIAGNFPEYVIGGGFTSRCVFVYEDKKAKLVAYPGLVIPAGKAETETKLVQDLEHISNVIIGPFQMTPDAINWGVGWYKTHNEGGGGVALRDDDRFGGYNARKQTHVHKLAMVLSAARTDEMVISMDDLKTAYKMVTDLEEDLPKVFSKIGRTEESIQAERFIKYVQAKGSITYEQGYAFIHLYFPKVNDFEAIMLGAVRSGQIIYKDGKLRSIGYVPPAASPSSSVPPTE